jgi:hypothetical protein
MTRASTKPSALHEPGPCEDADRVGVVVAAGPGLGVEVGGPGVGAAAVAGEVADGVAQLFVDGPAERDDPNLARLAGGGGDIRSRRRRRNRRWLSPPRPWFLAPTRLSRSHSLLPLRCATSGEAPGGPGTPLPVAH